MKKVLPLMTLCLGVIYYTLDPNKVSLFPKCPFYLLTGYLCPGCGSQRAIHSLLHFDFISAFSYNAFLVIILPFILFLIFIELQKTKYNIIYSKLSSLPFALLYILIITFWWIFRNI